MRRETAGERERERNRRHREGERENHRILVGVHFALSDLRSLQSLPFASTRTSPDSTRYNLQFPPSSSSISQIERARAKERVKRGREEEQQEERRRRGRRSRRSSGRKRKEDEQEDERRDSFLSPAQTTILQLQHPTRSLFFDKQTCFLYCSTGKDLESWYLAFWRATTLAGKVASLSLFLSLESEYVPVSLLYVSRSVLVSFDLL